MDFSRASLIQRTTCDIDIVAPRLYWPLATQYTVGLRMPLVDVPLVEMGRIRFAAGSHHKGFFPGVGELSVISDKSQDFFQQLIATQSENEG